MEPARRASRIRRALARLARRDRPPRAWWYPLHAEPRPASGADAKAAADRQREISERVRKAVLTQLAFCSFCLLTLGAPDAALLTASGKIPLPFADTDVDFLTFMAVAPLIIVAQSLYLHVYVGHWLRVGGAPASEAVPLLFRFGARFPGRLAYLAYYWLAPVTLAAFAAKAAPRITGTWLALLACGFTAALVFLQLRRDVLGGLPGARVVLFALLALLAGGAGRIAIWMTSHGERPFARPWNLEGAKLEEANLVGIDLTGASFRRARLRAANLSRAQLRGASFANADLTNASLAAADLRGANLTGARLEGTDLRQANLRYVRARDTDFRLAKVHAAQLRGVCFDGTTEFTPEQEPPQLAPQCTPGEGSAGWGRCRGVHPPKTRCDLSVIRRVVSPLDGYVRACLGVCDAYYSDRGDDHVLLEIPPELEGGAWVKTVNTGDKSEDSERFLELEIRPPAWVWIAFDSRAKRPPDWLATQFEKTTLEVELNEPDPKQKFVLYRRKFVEPHVVLGGNRAPGADFGRAVGSNYVVIVKRIPPGSD